jgi:hypothetical protein
MRDRVLTLIIVGRNDDHQGGYLYRLETALNMLANNLNEIGRLSDVEVLFVDWGSASPIADSLKLGSAAADLVEFIEVPFSITSQLLPDGRMYPTLAVNVGVRRASGRFIALGDSDCLYTTFVLEMLLGALSGERPVDVDLERMILPLRRYQVPWSLVQRQPGIGALERFIKSAFGSFRAEMPSAGFLGGFAGAQLMHRNLWHEARGYDESLKESWGWADNDLHLRLGQKYSSFDLGYFGICLFHLEHRAPFPDPAPNRSPRTVNPMVISQELRANDESWGLGSVTLSRRRVAPRFAPTRGLSAAVELSPLTGRFRSEDLPVYLDRYDVRTIVRHCLASVPPNLNGALRSTVEELVGSLAAYCCLEYPVNAFFFGHVPRHALEPVIRATLSVETYLVNLYPPGVSDNLAFHPGILSGVMEQVQFSGYASIIGGGYEDAIDRIRGARPGLGAVELAVVDQASVGPHFDALLTQLLEELAIGGAVFIILAHPGDQGEEATIELDAIKGRPPEGGDFRVSLFPSGSLVCYSRCADGHGGKCDDRTQG